MPAFVEAANSVRLVGRVSADPVRRELPSGDLLWTLRVVVDRDPPVNPDSRRAARVDTLDCAAWTPRVQRTVEGWQDGDLVEVDGSLRRRFYRQGGVTRSRVEVEITRARRRHRASTA